MTNKRDDLLKKAVSLRRLIISYTYGIVGSFEQAEDVYQETIVVICNRFEQYQVGTNERAWILEIARRTALGVVTKSYRKREHAISDDALSALASDFDAQAEAEQLFKSTQKQQALDQCFSKLSQKARDLMNQRYVKNLSCEEIAESSSRSVNSIYVTLTRIRKALRSCVLQLMPGEIFE